MSIFRKGREKQLDTRGRIKPKMELVCCVYRRNKHCIVHCYLYPSLWIGQSIFLYHIFPAEIKMLQLCKFACGLSHQEVFNANKRRRGGCANLWFHHGAPTKETSLLLNTSRWRKLFEKAGWSFGEYMRLCPAPHPRLSGWAASLQTKCCPLLQTKCQVCFCSAEASWWRLGWV